MWIFTADLDLCYQRIGEQKIGKMLKKLSFLKLSIDSENLEKPFDTRGYTTTAKKGTFGAKIKKMVEGTTLNANCSLFDLSPS